MTRKGVWGLQQVRDKQLQSLWEQSYTIWAMGQGNKGEILNNLNGDNASRSSPTQLGGTLANGWATVESGSYGSFFATRENGELWVCGANNQGQLGLNQQGTGDSGSTYRSSPAQVPGTTWDYVKCRMESTIGVKTDGTLWSWGEMQNGSLGQNQSWAAGPQTGVRGFSSPTQIGTDTTWTNNFDCGANVGAIKTDGTLWVWGSNGGGRLGLSQPAGPGQRSSPAQLPGTTWSYFVNGASTNGAIKTDGTLWLWGNNEVGSLGLNNKTDYSSPKQVGTDTTWSDLAMSSSSGEAAVAAVKTDGTMWTWGGNEQGELGQNDKTDYSSPRQIGTGTDWKHVWGDGPEGGRKFWATKTDGTIWNWGNGGYGSLDHNVASSDSHQFSSPTQMGDETVYDGLNKRQVSTNDRHSYIMKPALTPSQL